MSVCERGRRGGGESLETKQHEWLEDHVQALQLRCEAGRVRGGRGCEE